MIQRADTKIAMATVDQELMLSRPRAPLSGASGLLCTAPSVFVGAAPAPIVLVTGAP